jgi:hypothetical protein
MMAGLAAHLPHTGILCVPAASRNVGQVTGEALNLRMQLVEAGVAHPCVTVAPVALATDRLGSDVVGAATIAPVGR